MKSLICKCRAWSAGFGYRSRLLIALLERLLRQNGRHGSRRMDQKGQTDKAASRLRQVRPRHCLMSTSATGSARRQLCRYQEVCPEVFGIDIDKDALQQVLAAYYQPSSGDRHGRVSRSTRRTASGSLNCSGVNPLAQRATGRSWSWASSLGAPCRFRRSKPFPACPITSFHRAIHRKHSPRTSRPCVLLEIQSSGTKTGRIPTVLQRASRAHCTRRRHTIRNHWRTQPPR